MIKHSNPSGKILIGHLDHKEVYVSSFMIDMVMYEKNGPFKWSQLYM